MPCGRGADQPTPIVEIPGLFKHWEGGLTQRYPVLDPALHPAGRDAPLTGLQVVSFDLAPRASPLRAPVSTRQRPVPLALGRLYVLKQSRHCGVVPSSWSGACVGPEDIEHSSE